MAINYEKYAKDGNRFLKTLAARLGHEEEIQRTGIILRAVLHTLRDRLTVSEAMDLMAQLPMFLKIVYVEDWTYREKPSKINTLQEFTEEVKRHQDRYGENQFDWEMHTIDIVHTVLEELSPYISEGETRHILSQLPEEIKHLVEESIR
ncbi:MAG: DUF2267 domain-containing protein [Bacteroidota bacterium]